MGDGVAVGRGEGEGDGVREGVGDGGGEGVAEGVREGVTEGVAEGVRDGVTEEVGEGVTEGDGVAVGGGNGVQWVLVKASKRITHPTNFQLPISTPLKKVCSEARPRADFRTRGRVRELFSVELISNIQSLISNIQYPISNFQPPISISGIDVLHQGRAILRDT